MKTFLEYVDEAQKKLGLESDAAFAKHLGGQRTLVSNWRNDGKNPEDYYCILIAEVLGIDPLEVIAAANHARAKDDEKKTWWENFRKQHVKNVVGVLLVLGVLFNGFGATTGASQATAAAVVLSIFLLRIMYIMSSYVPATCKWLNVIVLINIVSSRQAISPTHLGTINLRS